MLTCTLTGTQLHKHTGYTTVHVPCTLPEPLSHFSNAPPTVLPARLSCLCCLLVWATKDSVRMHAHTQAPKNAPTTQCLPPFPSPPPHTSPRAASSPHLLVLPVGLCCKGLCVVALAAHLLQLHAQPVQVLALPVIRHLQVSVLRQLILGSGKDRKGWGYSGSGWVCADACQSWQQGHALLCMMYTMLQYAKVILCIRCVLLYLRQVQAGL